MTENEILIDFKNQLIVFFDELVDQFPSEPNLVIARLFISNQLDVKKAMVGFIHELNKDNNIIRTSIRNRNESFFTDHNIFGSIMNNDMFNHFGEIWKSDRLDDEDKKVIWNWIDAFVYLSNKYTSSLKL